MELGPLPTWVSGEGEALEEGERFSCFQGLFLQRFGGWRGADLQVSIEFDGSNILKNKHTLTETLTLSFSSLHIE